MKYCEVVNLKVYPQFQDLEEDDWLSTLSLWVGTMCSPLCKISSLNLVSKDFIQASQLIPKNLCLIMERFILKLIYEKEIYSLNKRFSFYARNALVPFY